MSVHVDSLSSEVVAEAPPQAGTADAALAQHWQEQAKAAAMRRRLDRDEQRTHAVGLDD
jgi:hypothetical protein